MGKKHQIKIHSFEEYCKVPMPKDFPIVSEIVAECLPDCRATYFKGNHEDRKK